LNLNAGCKRGQNGSVELQIPLLEIGRRDFFVFRAGEIRKKNKECEKRGDIGLLFEIIANFIYWHMYSELRQIGANFRAYHKFKRSPDTL
jgi:hypothetical protein